MNELTGRMARCTYYGRRTAKPGSYGGGNECNYGHRHAKTCPCEQPSSKDLPFFEFCGDGSRRSEQCAHCGCYESAHSMSHHKCANGYTPRGDRGYDLFYCGCHGWD